jgi:hypothetical protein
MIIMKIETDLKVIERISKEKEEENWDFRSFLKQYLMKMIFLALLLV